MTNAGSESQIKLLKAAMEKLEEQVMNLEIVDGLMLKKKEKHIFIYIYF